MLLFMTIILKKFFHAKMMSPITCPRLLCNSRFLHLIWEEMKVKKKKPQAGIYAYCMLIFFMHVSLIMLISFMLIKIGF